MLLGLGTENYSPSILRKIVFAGSTSLSFKKAEVALDKLAEISISSRHIERITERVGEELRQQRDEAVECWKAGEEIPHQDASVPAVAAISVDGGRVQTRADTSPPGVHNPQWRETKVGCLQTLQSEEKATDPHPDIPDVFLDPDRIHALANDLSASHPRTHADDDPSHPPPTKDAGRQRWQPTVIEQTCVASICPAAEFGPKLATEASRCNLDRADRIAFLGDGDPKNWTIHEQFFSYATPILDFIHLIEHLYEAADVAYRAPHVGWRLYSNLVSAAWRGNVDRVLALLEAQASRLGKPPDDADTNHPARVIARTIGYIRDNQHRMNYPEYRRLGLPINTCHVESLIKQFNYRVKATCKFWTVAGAEAILQVCSALFSSHDRLELFWQSRGFFLASKVRPYRRKAAA